MNALPTQHSVDQGRQMSDRLSPPTAILTLIIAMVSMPVILHGQSYTAPSASSPSPSPTGTLNDNILSVGQQDYRVVPADQYGSTSAKKEARPVTSRQAEAIASTIPDANVAFKQAVASADDFGANSVAPASCTSCETDRPDSMQAKLSKACNSCGAPGGAFGCIQCDSYFYGSVEAIHVDRNNDDTATISSRYGLSGFKEEMGTRITVGRIPNCVRGWEGTFTGIINWNSVGSLEAPIFLIQSNLFAVDPVGEEDISAFNNATLQSAEYDARYWSAEINRTYVGWEVAKMICGVRYIDFEESYFVYSENATENGFINSDIDNRLLGLQVGMDLTYPLLKKVYADFRGRAGAYANFMDLDLAVINDNEWAAGIEDKSVKAAGQFELAIGLRYEVTKKLSVKCGAEVWYLTGIGTAFDQLDNGIMGRGSVEGHDDLVSTALTYGAELRF